MRVTRYVRSDGENWIAANIRCSAHVAYQRLDALMLANGWIRWNKLRDRFNSLKQRIARENPTKYPNWKEVKIPMVRAGLKDLPAAIAAENEIKENIELVANDG